MNDEPKIVYRYFSHHIRNSTAFIATSVTLLSYNLSEDTEDLVAGVVEASYLLDLFDAGMGICMEHYFGDAQPCLADKFEIGPSIYHFFDQIKELAAEKSIKFTINADAAGTVEASVFVLRTITSLILYEVFLQAEKEICVDVNELYLKASADNFSTPPKVWRVYKEVLASHGVNFNYDDKGCELEYAE
jgi:hypothetical protein